MNSYFFLPRWHYFNTYRKKIDRNFLGPSYINTYKFKIYINQSVFILSVGFEQTLQSFDPNIKYLDPRISFPINMNEKAYIFFSYLKRLSNRANGVNIIPKCTFVIKILYRWKPSQNQKCRKGFELNCDVLWL